MALRSSQRSITALVNYEVSSPEVYVRLYSRPTRPAGESGVTVGIGYDLGYSTKAQVASDWRGACTADELTLMQSVAGLKGDAAQQALPHVRNRIDISLADAMMVFERVSMPRWEAIVLRALPGSENLSADCFGVLTSLTYNRGASYQKAGDRYTEMRAIRTAVMNGQPELVPGYIRSMKRLWAGKEGLRGLLTRRDAEAKMFEEGLRAAVPVFTATEEPMKADTGDDKTEDAPIVTPAGSGLNVQSQRARFDLETQIVQQGLIGRGYHEVGNADGLEGGKTTAGIAAFMKDRGVPSDGTVTPTLKAELNRAIAEGWTRPIAPERAFATAKDIAPKVASVDQTWYTKLWAWLLALPSFLVAAFKSLFGDYNDPASNIYAVKSFFSSIPTEYIFLAVGAVGFFILIQATRAQNATVKAYQKGEIN